MNESIGGMRTLDQLDELCLTLKSIDRLRSSSIKTANQAVDQIMRRMEEGDREFAKAVFILVFAETLYFLPPLKQLSIEGKVQANLRRYKLTREEKEQLIDAVRSKAKGIHGEDMAKLLYITMRARDALYIPLFPVYRLKR